MNAGAVLISTISNGSPMVITTAVNHGFVTGQVIIINSPLLNGLQNPAAASFQYQDFFFAGIITVTGLTTFECAFNTNTLTPFAAVVPAYAVPATYSCSQYANPTFTPAYRLISLVTNGLPAVVTTTINHDFVTGTVVRLMMPAGIGMFQADQQFGTITVTSPTTFTIPIDTTDYDAFVVFSASTSTDPHVNICALAVPIGEDNAMLNAATQNALP